MDNDNYMKNYKNMLNNDSILNQKLYNNQSGLSPGIDGKITKKQMGLSEKLYLGIKNTYPIITQYDIDKIFFDNNLSMFSSLKAFKSMSLYPNNFTFFAISRPFATANDILIAEKLPGP